eukprot:scaffold2636_cov340-Pavlova_lutheri.AAC.69
MDVAIHRLAALGIAKRNAEVEECWRSNLWVCKNPREHVMHLGETAKLHCEWVSSIQRRITTPPIVQFDSESSMAWISTAVHQRRIFSFAEIRVMVENATKVHMEASHQPLGLGHAT